MILVKLILYSILFFVIIKLFRWFFKPNTKKYASEPKVKTASNHDQKIKEEDIIEAKFEEIKSEDK